MKVLQLLLPLLLFAAVTTAGSLDFSVLEPSVTVKASYGTGSGVVFVRDDRCFVLTAGHVVASLRHVVTKLDKKEGRERKEERFDDASIVQVLYQEGRKVGKVEFDAKVIAYSDAEDGEDLALLEIRKRAFVTRGAKFTKDVKPLAIGTRIYHCGSLQGELGSNSLTDGIISRIGRVVKNKVYDQTNATAFPGSSGGGVFTEGGEYIGMITRGAGETFNLFIPARRIRSWLEREDLLWVIDSSLPIPKESKGESDKDKTKKDH